MSSPNMFAPVSFAPTDLRQPSRQASSRKTDTHFAGLMEEQAMRPVAQPHPGNEVRGRMNHQPMVDLTGQTNQNGEKAPAQTPAKADAQTAEGAKASAGIALNRAERRGRQQNAQGVTPQATSNTAPVAEQQKAQNASTAQGKSPQAVDPGLLASLMGDGNPRHISQLLGRSGQAVRAIMLTGEAPKGIALPAQGKGIALDAATQQQLARAHAADRPAATRTAATRTSIASSQNSKPKDLGKLAAQFESGSDGIAAIGYDRNGGTSYGKYQIASRPGTMTNFIDFLQETAPDMAQRLAAAGPANTGSRTGDMPTVWRELAAEQPEQFERLQEKFIHESHYLPARSALSQHGYQTEKFSPAMQEVLFSTAVQHGPAGASRIFARAAERVGLSGSTQQRQEQQLIQEIYTLRADQFGSSTPQVQTAVRRRMAQEQQLAMNMSRQKPAAA